MMEANELFAEIASDEEAWIFTAVDLLDTAEGLVPKIEEYWRIERERSRRREEAGRPLIFTYEPDPRAIYLMLIAYAVENLCKGLLVKKSVSRVWASALRKGELPSEITNHNLTTLLGQIAFPMSSDDRELAFRLERAAVWSARYPVPKSARHKTVMFKTATGEEVVPTWHREDDLALVRDFVSRLRDFVQEKLKESDLHEDR